MYLYILKEEYKNTKSGHIIRIQRNNTIMGLVRDREEVVTVERKDMFQEYVYNMVEYLHRTKGISREEAEEKVRKICREKIVDPKVDIIDHKSVGNSDRKFSTLSTYIGKAKHRVLTPNGAQYEPESNLKAFTCEMITEFIKTRKKIKHKQFAAKDAGDIALATKHKYGQSNLKITLNSLPGGYGSAFNLFYDKTGYNTITSSCRAFIAHSYVTAEVLMGGNYPLFNEDEVINHIITNVREAPPQSQIVSMMQKFNVKSVSKEHLHNYFKKIVSNYEYNNPLESTKIVIDNLEQHEVDYMYYLGNLRHLFWDNEEIFKPLVQQLLSTNDLDITNVDLKDFGGFDGDVEPVLLTVMNDIMGNNKLNNIVNNDPDGAKKVLAYNNKFEGWMESIKELFMTFIYTPTLIHNVLTRKNMVRNTVVISDTDSVIFTSKDWVLWYEGQIDVINQNSYNIRALMTYFLTRVNADVMEKFSVAIGSTKEGVYKIQMKNEYLYPALLLYNAKKVYAGIIKINEGLIMPEPEADLKGGALRSSKIPQVTKDFIEDLIVNKILKTAMESKISGQELIQVVKDYEELIKMSLVKGEIEFLDRQNVKMASDYANPDGTAYFYAMAWNHIFGDKHDNVMPPEKQAKIVIQKPSPEYYDWLKENYPETFKKWQEFVSMKKGKVPTAFVMSATCKKIPEELIPIIDVRTIIYNNLNPAYITLERLNISTGNKKKKVILSDLY